MADASTSRAAGHVGSSIEALPGSKLGTRAYWDSTYERELHTYDDIGDEGEVWFGEEAVQRMVDFLEQERDEGDAWPDQPTLLDLGTGNGHLLFALRELDPPLTEADRMLGIDYADASVRLAQRIAEKRGKGCERVRFEVHDLLQDRVVEQLAARGQGWDLITDKGTLDAIALSASDGYDPVQRYATSVRKLAKPGSLLVITSCNFTQDELGRIFADGFAVHRIVPTPSFSFGGQKGSTTATVAFRRLAGSALPELHVV